MSGRTQPTGKSSEERERIWWEEAYLRKRNMIETSFLEVRELRIINREGGMIKCKTSHDNGTQSSLFVETNTRIKRKVLVSLPWIRRKGCTQSLTHSFTHVFIHLCMMHACFVCSFCTGCGQWSRQRRRQSWIHPLAPDVCMQSPTSDWVLTSSSSCFLPNLFQNVEQR